MRHAYLILAHSSKLLLTKLIEALDDARNDIYVHIDRKAEFDLADISTTYSRLYFLPDRIDARWGDYSLVDIEYRLLYVAYEKGYYSYYHILSGVDYPLKSQDYIHYVCDQNYGKQFIGYAEHTPRDEIKWRSQHYFIFSKDYMSNNMAKRFLRAIIARIQSLIGYRRFDKEVKKGCQWCSITDDFVAYLLENQHIVEKYFNHTYCPDEMFIQTLCWHSRFKDSIFTIEDEFEGCMRYILWEEGVIRNLDDIEPEVLVSSGRWFGRKFSEASIDKLAEIKRLYSTNLAL